MPSLRQLEYLVAVSETRHFRRAAERCNTTQPTLSEQIKALERRLGVQVIERSTSRVVVTPIGLQVIDIAKRMLRDAHEIRVLSASGGKELAGLLRLGLPPTIGPYLMKHAAPNLHKKYPDLKLYVREDIPQMLPRALEDGIHDVIIAPLPIKGAEIESVPLFREPLFLTVAADHPLALRKSVKLSDLNGDDMLALGPGHQLHEAVAKLCEEAGARLRYDFEGTSLDMLREMVIMRLGITFMPGLYVASELHRDASVRTLEIRDRSVSRSIGMAWRKTSGRRQSYLKLADFFRSLMVSKTLLKR